MRQKSALSLACPVMAAEAMEVVLDLGTGDGPAERSAAWQALAAAAADDAGWWRAGGAWETSGRCQLA